MKADRAVVMSFYQHETSGTIRINLKWEGNHQVDDFRFDWLGEVLDYGTETEHTGWVTVTGVHLTGLHIGEEFPLLKAVHH
jgi:hypothetical protein